MRYQKYHSTLLQVSAVSLLTLLLGSFSLPVWADDLVVPTNIGLPGRREGGATRDGCYSSQKFLQALTPEINIGKTLAAKPTFFVFVPPNNAEMGEVIIEEVQGSTKTRIYRADLPMSQEFGVIGLTPLAKADAPELEAGKTYRWTFQLYCDGNPGDYVEGWIQRVPPSAELAEALKNASERDRLSLYAKEQYWYDQLQALVDLRRQQDDSMLSSNWKNILTSVGLGELASERLVPCCTTTNASNSLNPK